jgi:hypothetical protein
MSLSVFPKKITKAHLNASFQCTDLETSMLYKNTLINPFHYALQYCRALVKAATVKIEEEQNEFNWKVNKKDKSRFLPSSKESDMSNRWMMSVEPAQICAG